MARYSSFMGRRVEVHYRASDTLLPASGIFVADSGRSIFLEQSFEQRGQHRHFRWEIPYQYLVKIGVSEEEPEKDLTADAAAAKAEDRNCAQEVADTVSGSEATLASSAAAGMGLVSAIFPVGRRSKPA
ncbi:MAG TPA: hypothetical protein VE545_06245 [Candidatus Dormibacteraeota bacterium]|nr:hypothetical protein [Candidatus Dormibacteraeota bacterium]